MNWQFWAQILDTPMKMRVELVAQRMVMDGRLYHDLGFRVYASIVDADRPVLHDVVFDRLWGIKLTDKDETEKMLRRILKPGVRVFIEVYDFTDVLIWKDDKLINRMVVSNGYADDLCLPRPETDHSDSSGSVGTPTTKRKDAFI